MEHHVSISFFVIEFNVFAKKIDAIIAFIFMGD